MQTLMVKTGTRYRKATPAEVAEVHGTNVVAEINRTRPLIAAPREAVAFLREAIGGRDYEVFVVVGVDTRHRVLQVVELFRGTVDGASVHPREVVKFAVQVGAAGVLFAHNHPSGVAEASMADRAITELLTKALALIDVRVLDHIVITLGGAYSLAENRRI